MKIRFYVEKRNDEDGRLLVKDCPVFMSVSFSGNRIIIGTGIRVDMQGWDPERQRLKATHAESYAANAWFEALIDTANSSLKALQNSQIEVKSEQFQKLFNELKPKFSTGFFDVFYMFMEINSARWSPSTYRKVRTVYKHLREFETHSAFEISFNNLDASFLNGFIAFYEEKGNSMATTYKAVNTLVWFLNWATEKGYNVYKSYREFYKMMSASPVTSQVQVYLKWEEVLSIRNFVPDTRKMERVRDLFCFMCFSGVRFSELQVLKKGDIGEDDVIIRKKDGKLRRLQLNKYAREIYLAYINKYYLNNTAFPTISIITMNKYLRLLGKEAGLERNVPLKGKDDEVVPLYERLTAGIAVNTFIANALELKVPFEIISSFTGVKNDSRVRQIKMELAKEEVKKFDGNVSL